MTLILPVRRLACILLAISAAPVSASTLLPDFASAKFKRNAPIDNPYLPYAQGTRFEMRASGVADGEPFEERGVITVLGPGPKILGVRATTVLDEAYEDDRLVERTEDFFAQDTAGNVWYLGEDVTNFRYDEDDNLIGTDSESAWRAGRNNALPGWAMPAEQIIGRNYYQEFAAEDDALDEGTTFAILDELIVGATTYTDVLQVFESSAIEPELREFKFYAAGVGFIRAEEDLDATFANPGLVSDRVAVAPVPLPASLPLLLGAVAVLGGLRRLRTAHAGTGTPVLT